MKSAKYWRRYDSIIRFDISGQPHHVGARFGDSRRDIGTYRTMRSWQATMALA